MSICRYQYLLLADAPVTPFDSAHGDNYARRRARAEDRYLAWEQSGKSGPALQILISYAVTDERALATRAMPTSMRRRYRLDVTPPGAGLMTYWDTSNRRYLYLQPGIASAMPDHLGHALVRRLPALISTFPGEGSLAAASASERFPLFAIGCTCRDFALSGLDRAGNPGPSFYGCKHMLFYNLCRARGEPEAIMYA